MMCRLINQINHTSNLAEKITPKRSIQVISVRKSLNKHYKNVLFDLTYNLLHKLLGNNGHDLFIYLFYLDITY